MVGSRGRADRPRAKEFIITSQFVIPIHVQGHFVVFEQSLAQTSAECIPQSRNNLSSQRNTRAGSASNTKVKRRKTKLVSHQVCYDGRPYLRIRWSALDPASFVEFAAGFIEFDAGFVEFEVCDSVWRGLGDCELKLFEWEERTVPERFVWGTLFALSRADAAACSSLSRAADAAAGRKDACVDVKLVGI
jgi:hypothetical protein